MKTIRLIIVLALIAGCYHESTPAVQDGGGHTASSQIERPSPQLGNPDYEDRWYAGVVNGDGTPSRLPDGWWSEQMGTGVYNVIHDFNMADPTKELILVPSPANIPGLSAVVTTNGEDVATIVITNHKGEYVDSEFRFVAYHNP